MRYFLILSGLFCCLRLWAQGPLSNFNLQPQYQSLATVSIDSTAMIVKALSIKYGKSVLKSRDTLYFYTKNSQYNLYQDSLALYYLTYQQPDLKKSEAVFQKEVVPTLVQEDFSYPSISAEIAAYERTLQDHLQYEYRIKVPVSYRSFDWLLAAKKEYTIFCTYYNQDRIRTFNCHYDDVAFQLAWHKTILPIKIESVKMYFSNWMPRKTHYAPPKVPIHPTLDSRLIWEKNTGLSYEVAIELGIADDPLRLSKIIYAMKKSRRMNLSTIQMTWLDQNTSQMQEFILDCDTCDLNFSDFSLLDQDVIQIYYGNQSIIIDTLSLEGRHLSFPAATTPVIYLVALSEGTVPTCTANILIGGNSFTLSLLQGKVCRINLRRRS